jgi:hypothetical protein
VQTLFITTKSHFIPELHFSVTRILVVTKRVSTTVLGFIHSRKLGKSLEKLFSKISMHEKQGEDFVELIFSTTHF